MSIDIYLYASIAAHLDAGTEAVGGRVCVRVCIHAYICLYTYIYIHI